MPSNVSTTTRGAGNEDTKRTELSRRFRSHGKRDEGRARACYWRTWSGSTSAGARTAAMPPAAHWKSQDPTS